MSRRSMVVGAVALAACGVGDVSTGPAAPTVVDSAGVRIVTNRIPAQGLPEYASLALEPDLELTGGQAGPFVDIERAITLKDGRIVVANRGTFEVRYYDANGTFLLEVGEEGNRFGTFRDLSRIGRGGGDSVWVYDVRSERLTMFDESGTPVLDATAPGQEFVSGRFGDGSFLLVPGWRTDFHTRNPSDDVRRDPAVYHRWTPATGDTVEVGSFPHNEVLVLEPEEAEGIVMGTPPFGRQTVRAVGPGRFYVGDQETFEIRGFDPDGTLREIIRVLGVDLELTPAMVQAARNASGPDADDAPWAGRFWAAVPGTRPAYGLLLLDTAGNLWVGEHVTNLTPPRNWMVFGADGTMKGLVEVPPNLRILEIGQNYVLGATPGLPGAEIIRRYPLTRLR